MIRDKAKRRNPKPPMIKDDNTSNSNVGGGNASSTGATAGTDATNPKKGQMGEGSYEGTRDYQKSVKDYLAEDSVQQDMKNSAPKSSGEAEELKEAEEQGRSHSHAPGE